MRGWGDGGVVVQRAKGQNVRRSLRCSGLHASKAHDNHTSEDERKGDPVCRTKSFFENPRRKASKDNERDGFLNDLELRRAEGAAI